MIPQPSVKEFEFLCERVVQRVIDSQIAQVLLLFDWQPRIGVRLSENIEMIEGHLPDIFFQERG